MSAEEEQARECGICFLALTTRTACVSSSRARSAGSEWDLRRNKDNKRGYI